MVTVIYGSTTIKGVLNGFSPGSNEFEIELDQGLKVLLSATGGLTGEKMMRMRASMNAIGLASLRNSAINFTTGMITLSDGPKEEVKVRPNSIRSSFVG